MFVSFALIFVSVAFAATSDVLGLTFLNHTTARCIDGSPFGYYSRLNSDSNKWVIYLEGGGLCLSPTDCASRAKTTLGSSTAWKSTFTPTLGTTRDILSNDPKINPFWDWNHVYLDYCSGDTWSGTKTEKTSDGFYFTGHYNVKEVISHLNKTANLGLTFDVVMLTGASAGGIGTFANAGYLRHEWLPRSSGKILAVPMSGYYFPSPIIPYGLWEKGEDDSISVLATQVVTEWFGSALNTACVMANPSDKNRCWDASFLYPYIDVPLFVIENRFDKNQINAEWLPKPYQAKNKTRSMAYIEYYGTRMYDSLTEFANKTAAKGNALFMPSCYDHVVDLCLQSGPTVQGRQVAGLLKSWVDLQMVGTKPTNYVFIDDCNSKESTTKPCSTTCRQCQPAFFAGMF